MTDAIRKLKDDLSALDPHHTVWHGLSAGDLLSGLAALEAQAEGATANDATEWEGRFMILGHAVARATAVMAECLSSRVVESANWHEMNEARKQLNEAVLASAPSDVVPISKQELEWLLNCSDLQMEDGDTARRLARRWLAGSRS